MWMSVRRVSVGVTRFVAHHTRALVIGLVMWVLVRVADMSSLVGRVWVAMRKGRGRGVAHCMGIVMHPWIRVISVSGVSRVLVRLEMVWVRLLLGAKLLLLTLLLLSLVKLVKLLFRVLRMSLTILFLELVAVNFAFHILFLKFIDLNLLVLDVGSPRRGRLKGLLEVRLGYGHADGSLPVCIREAFVGDALLVERCLSLVDLGSEAYSTVLVITTLWIALKSLHMSPVMRLWRSHGTNRWRHRMTLGLQ